MKLVRTLHSVCLRRTRCSSGPWRGVKTTQRRRTVGGIEPAIIIDTVRFERTYLLANAKYGQMLNKMFERTSADPS